MAKKIGGAPQKKSSAKGSQRATPIKKSIQKKKPKRIFFTVAEDCKILAESLKKSKQPFVQRTEILAKMLGRSAESIRDRTKKYLSKLSAAEQKTLRAAAKKTPKFYVHFSPGKIKSMLAINEQHPSAFNRKSKEPKKPRVSAPRIRNRGKTPIDPRRGSRVSERRPRPANDFRWIAQKMRDIDPYFALDHAVSLLSDTLTHLVETGQATPAQVESFIRNTHHSINFDDIFNHFKLKNE